MPGLHIGKLAADEVVKDEVIKKDFIELRKTAEQMVCAYFLFVTACRSVLSFCALNILFLDLFLRQI